MNDAFHTLEGTWDQVWQRLGRGVADARSAMRTVSLATSGVDGPEVRTVVLRAAEREKTTLEVHSDARTRKVVALRHDPRIAVLAWDPRAQFQIRLMGTVTILEADPERWSRIPPGNKVQYGAQPAPGTPIPFPKQAEGANITDFVALRCHLTRIETIHLGRDLHRLTLYEGPDWVGQWLSP